MSENEQRSGFDNKSLRKEIDSIRRDMFQIQSVVADMKFHIESLADVFPNDQSVVGKIESELSRITDGRKLEEISERLINIEKSDFK
mmetsp:Transcript_14012/g.20731  ORF Transcript_14012/g.20731 Transcript_14012/m.20731 type:complete len:87 (+) Transcript_14012:32-292(+)